MRLVLLHPSELSMLRFVESAGGAIAVVREATRESTVCGHLVEYGFLVESATSWSVTSLGRRALIRTKDVQQGLSVEVPAVDYAGQRLPGSTE